MPSKDTKMLQFNQYHKFDKTPNTIYADLECLIKRNYECKYDPITSTTKVGDHNPCGYSMSSIIWAFDGIKTKHGECRGKDCRKRFCKSIEEHTVEIIKFEKKKIIPLTERTYRRI